MTARRWAGVAAAMLLVPLAGCAGEGQRELISGHAGRADVGLADYLAALPAEQAADPELEVRYGDFVRAAEVAGVTPPDDSSNEQATIDYITEVVSIPGRVGSDPPTVAVVLPDRVQSLLGDQADFRGDMGWDLLDVDRYVELAGDAPRVTVLDGEFDQGSLVDALGERRDGVWIAGDPERRQDLGEPSPARPLGEPLWSALGDDRLLVAESADGMDALRHLDGGRTLADDPTLAAIARAFDAAAAYTAQLHRPGGLPEVAEGDLGPAEPSVCRTGPLVPPAAFGFGLADDGEPLALLALSYATAADAEASAGPVEQWLESWQPEWADEDPAPIVDAPTEVEGPMVPLGWNDLTDLESVGLDQDVVVARFRFTHPAALDAFGIAMQLGPASDLEHTTSALCEQ